MAKRKNIIELRDVWKTYLLGAVQVHALRGINVEIKENEFVSIQGPSGSGKSTAMNLVGALDIPSKGKIFLEGKDIAKMSESQLAVLRGQKIGFVFQQFNLMPTLTALQNVTLPMIFQGMPALEREKRGTELLKLVGLGERIHHRPTEISGGEMQRVAIARALSNNPDVLLADEPTGNLDSKTGEEIMALLQNIYKEGKTIIIVTHDEDIAHHAKRHIYLKDGQIVK